MNRYQEFFVEDAKGRAFVKQLYELIDSEHAHAEDEPELALEHTQRAKGIREVVNLIQSLSAGTKKGRSPISDSTDNAV